MGQERCIYFVVLVQFGQQSRLVPLFTQTPEEQTRHWLELKHTISKGTFFPSRPNQELKLYLIRKHTIKKGGFVKPDQIQVCFCALLLKEADMVLDCFLATVNLSYQASGNTIQDTRLPFNFYFALLSVCPAQVNYPEFFKFLKGRLFSNISSFWQFKTMKKTKPKTSLVLYLFFFSFICLS